MVETLYQCIMDVRDPLIAVSHTGRKTLKNSQFQKPNDEQIRPKTASKVHLRAALHGDQGACGAVEHQRCLGNTGWRAPSTSTD